MTEAALTWMLLVHLTTGQAIALPVADEKACLAAMEQFTSGRSNAIMFDALPGLKLPVARIDGCISREEFEGRGGEAGT